VMSCIYSYYDILFSPFFIYGSFLVWPCSGAKEGIPSRK
jgi:hypothetical protein